MLFVSLLIIGYLLGSISSAVLICRILQLPDPRITGSNNPGATNVLRIGGKKAAAAVLLCDVGKGVCAVGMARIVNMPETLLAWVALAAVVGHLFPLFFNFQGGKGVATAVGGIAIVLWPLALLAVLVWVIVAKLTRISSLAALTAVLITVIASLFWGFTYFFPLAIMAALLIWRHRSNIQRILTGQESKIGDKNSAKLVIPEEQNAHEK
ncbi:MAG: glycerol-3-phosphate 1-O-acyltransferase PlsY [Gammaproteobacteria bacterium]